MKAAKEAGRWRTARTPYLKAIMDCLSPSSPVERVVFMKGAQVGGTECGNNWLGYVIHHTPGPMMYVLPTLDMAKRTSKQRIAPMIEEMPILKERVKDSRSRGFRQHPAGEGVSQWCADYCRSQLSDRAAFHACPVSISR